MSNNRHNTAMQRQLIAVLVLVNTLVLRDDYLANGSPDGYGMVCFLLSMLAVWMAGKKSSRMRKANSL